MAQGYSFPLWSELHPTDGTDRTCGSREEITARVGNFSGRINVTASASGYVWVTWTPMRKSGRTAVKDENGHEVVLLEGYLSTGVFKMRQSTTDDGCSPRIYPADLINPARWAELAEQNNQKTAEAGESR